MTAPTTELLQTPFYNHHLEQGGKIVDFAGWAMPLHYGSILDEHHAVRNGAGIFDVSHMARIKFTGRHARRFLDRVFTRSVNDIPERACRYGFICNEQGGVKDDVIIYRFDDHWLMVANASNRLKLLEHFDAVKGDLAVKIDDQTTKTGMVAIQGPKAMDVIARFSSEVPTIKRYTFVTKNLLILKLIISRTGYTGEDGVEVILNASMVGMAMKLLMKEQPDGKPLMQPAGLGCRDTLRMEAGMPLYGHELSEDIDALANGFSFALTLNKDQDDRFGDPEPFIGLAALKKIAAEGGPKTKLVGLKLEGKRTARQGAAVRSGDSEVGRVTSGCLSPTLGYPIAMAYVDASQAEVGKGVSVEVGSGAADGQIVDLPFYKPAK